MHTRAGFPETNGASCWADIGADVQYCSSSSSSSSRSCLGVLSRVAGMLCGLDPSSLPKYNMIRHDIPSLDARGDTHVIEAVSLSSNGGGPTAPQAQTHKHALRSLCSRLGFPTDDVIQRCCTTRWASDNGSSQMA